jgi:hypothetical protein
MVSHALQGFGMTIPHAELIPLARMMPILAAAGFPTRHFSRKGWSVSRAGDLIGRVRQPFPDRAWGTSRIFRRVESELILMARIRHARMILKTSRDRWFRMEQQALFEREVLGFPSK